MFITYAIYNQSKTKIYIGHTISLDQRLKRHNGELPNKKTSFTCKNKGSWTLIYQENFNTRKEAVKREKELKSAKGREFIKNLIKK